VLVDDVGDERNRHIDIAATLARSLFDPPRGHRSDRAGSDEAFLRVWFRYLAAEWMSRGPYNKAWDAIDMGRQQAGEDAELDLAEGALHELTWRLAHEERQRVFGFAGDLEHAERALKKALGVDPHLDEARLRLARVQTKRGRPADAIDTLAPMESPATEPGFLYLARLFEGDAWEAQQELRRAEAAYRAAMAVLPQSASAPLSLAHLLFIHGRRDEASDLVRSLATSATAQSQQEPWLPYRLGTSWRSTGYLDDLRDIVMVHK
jgi:tetratricopeptide (TPR) repeat protein